MTSDRHSAGRPATVDRPDPKTARLRPVSKASPGPRPVTGRSVRSPAVVAADGRDADGSGLDQPRSPKPLRRRPQIVPSAQRFLLVEDNPGDARLLREMLRELEAQELELTVAESMTEAERHLALQEVDMVLLDLGLPDVHGLVAVQRAHAAAPRAALVVLTALDDEQLAARALREGAQDYLVKGQINSGGLRRALHHAVERKDIEGALLTEKERAEVTLKSIGDAVICTESSGNITFINPVAAQLTGWTADEATGRPVTTVLQIMDDATSAVLSNPMGTAASENRTVHLTKDSRLVRRDGREVPIDDAISPIHDRDGRTAGSVIVFRDVSEGRAMAAQVRRVGDELERTNAELERSNRELQDFATSASHDLQEPLRKIQAFGDLLSERSSAVLDEESSDYLQRMRDAAARMQTLVDYLLEYSRIATKPEPLEPVDLSQVVSEVLVDLDERLRETKGRVLAGPLPTLPAYPLQMRALFQNLIANALKFHPEGVAPEVHIEAAAPDVKGRPHGDPVWEIRVRDSGIGFEQRYAERVFAPFERLHGHQAFDGSGMGLAICRRVVTILGGTITAESKPGSGTTFLITLPKGTAAVPGEPA